MHNCTVYLSWALDGGGGVGGEDHAPVALPPRKTRYPLYMNKGPLKHGFRITASWRLQKLFRVCTVSSPAGMEGDRLLGPLPPRLTGTVYHDFLGNFLLTYCKMWIYRPQFINGSCMMVLHQIFFLQFWHSWSTEWPACSPDLSSLDSYFWGHMKATVNATTVRTCSNEYRMDWEWFNWHLDFSSKSGSHCSDVKRPVLKRSVDTASILCNILEAVTRKTCFRSSVFIAYIFLVFGLDSLL
jgi:hypothetical protein